MTEPRRPETDASTTPMRYPEPARDGTIESEERQIAGKRVERRRKLAKDAVAYVVVNAFLLAVWAVTGLGDDRAGR
jgi:hypothetical protein